MRRREPKLPEQIQSESQTERRLVVERILGDGGETGLSAFAVLNDHDPAYFRNHELILATPKTGLPNSIIRLVDGWGDGRGQENASGHRR